MEIWLAAWFAAGILSTYRLWKWKVWSEVRKENVHKLPENILDRSIFILKVAVGLIVFCGGLFSLCVSLLLTTTNG